MRVWINIRWRRDLVNAGRDQQHVIPDSDSSDSCSLKPGKTYGTLELDEQAPPLVMADECALSSRRNQARIMCHVHNIQCSQ